MMVVRGPFVGPFCRSAPGAAGFGESGSARFAGIKQGGLSGNSLIEGSSGRCSCHRLCRGRCRRRRRRGRQRRQSRRRRDSCGRRRRRMPRRPRRRRRSGGRRRRRRGRLGLGRRGEARGRRARRGVARDLFGGIDPHLAFLRVRQHGAAGARPPRALGRGLLAFLYVRHQLYERVLDHEPQAHCQCRILFQLRQTRQRPQRTPEVVDVFDDDGAGWEIQRLPRATCRVRPGGPLLGAGPEQLHRQAGREHSLQGAGELPLAAEEGDGLLRGLGRGRGRVPGGVADPPPHLDRLQALEQLPDLVNP
mmetsp:Transcript_135410/g.433029  ORF Transcript_135410/g.433029 Transcript_135410/m.433029 type:complete len:306 (-) Transcript_135410:516-1433(-)